MGLRGRTRSGGATRTGCTKMYVSEIRVREGWRKHGIGTEFLRLVEERAWEMGIDALYLHAEADCPDAVRHC